MNNVIPRKNTRQRLSDTVRRRILSLSQVESSAVTPIDGELMRLGLAYYNDSHNVALTDIGRSCINPRSGKVRADIPNNGKG